MELSAFQISLIKHMVDSSENEIILKKKEKKEYQIIIVKMII